MKKFCYFIRSQVVGCVVLMVLCVVVLLVMDGVMDDLGRESSDADSIELAFREEVKAFEQSLKEDKEARKRAYEDRAKWTRNDWWNVAKEDYVLHSFDPNIADSLDFINLGLTPRVAGNILSYRKAGGCFRTAEALSKVYGMTAEKYEELEPYILIEAKDSVLVAPVFAFVVKKDTVLELNSADTTELKYIRGIGSGYAKAIVRYRGELGGYSHVDQLAEIAMLSKETYEAVKDYFVVNAALIKPIEVNRASVDFMRRHPYVSFYQAQGIYELRRMEFELDSIEQLEDIEGCDTEWLERMRPYMKFE